MARTVDPARHEAKRLLILEAAAECFARKGFERATTAEICGRAGISSGSLFHYFPSKRAIFVALFELDGRERAELLERANRVEDPVAGLLAVVDGLVAPLSDPSAPGLVAAVTAQAGRDPELVEVLVRNEIQLREGLKGLLLRAIALRRVDAGLDPERAAGWIAALVDAAFARVSADRDLVVAEEVEMLRLILTRFLNIS
ncbi:TetR/AcrR family transcriptional regulator [Allokutzneria sp. NRRL B-24872]|uniref:TetR/AcrR family transcriptional regulator n=1 Tax=Allokutzneria sp. NRRL B-24872 TaxID=1137961 RepID=UPI000A3A2455|nr:TetR/AcrR family transcriptional regulator [Allokutzneria sp. NRRL B-24872]